MTDQEHWKFWFEAKDAISLFCDVVFRDKEVPKEELEKAADTLNKLEIKYKRAHDTLTQVGSKIHHYNKGR